MVIHLGLIPNYYRYIGLLFANSQGNEDIINEVSNLGVDRRLVMKEIEGTGVMGITDVLNPEMPVYALNYNIETGYPLPISVEL